MEVEQGTPNRFKNVRLLLWFLVALALVGAAALFLIPRSPTGQEQPTVNASFGAPFTLQGTNGQPFPSSSLRGKPYAIFFGFTHCPDVCPTTLARLAQLRKSAGGESAFDIVFVSIDPERDGPKEMAEYSQQFETPIIALTGSPAQIDAVKKSYGVFAEKDPLPEGQHSGHGDYMMKHTSSVLLYDRSGKLSGMISATDADDAALAKLKAIRA